MFVCCLCCVCVYCMREHWTNWKKSRIVIADNIVPIWIMILVYQTQVKHYHTTKCPWAINIKFNKLSIDFIEKPKEQEFVCVSDERTIGLGMIFQFFQPFSSWRMSFEISSNFFSTALHNKLRDILQSVDYSSYRSLVCVCVCVKLVNSNHDTLNEVGLFDNTLTCIVYIGWLNKTVVTATEIQSKCHNNI